MARPPAVQEEQEAPLGLNGLSWLRGLDRNRRDGARWAKVLEINHISQKDAPQRVNDSVPGGKVCLLQRNVISSQVNAPVDDTHQEGVARMECIDEAAKR